MRTRSTLIALLVAGSLLGACHKAQEQPAENQATENQVTEPAVPAPPTVAPEPEAVPKPKPVIAKAKALPKPTADEQMLDDADATGMTSHAARDTDDTGGSSNTQN